jgi:hypothetical protein
MPVNGTKKKPSAIGASGSPEKGFLLSAIWFLLVWMVSVIGVDLLPAGIVAGEKTAEAPKGRPVAFRVSALG